MESGIRTLKSSPVSGILAVPAGTAVFGGAAPFDQIYDQWFGRVLRWVGSLGAAAYDREDLAQEVFVIAHRRLGTFDGRNLGAWLYQIARRKVRDYLRLSHVVYRNGGRSVPFCDEALAGVDGQQDAFESAECGELLSNVLGTLAAHQSREFLLFEVEGRSGEEIAELQGVPLNTVWTRIFRARKQLRANACRLKLGRLLVA